MKFVISGIDDNRKSSEIIQEVHALKAISWIKAAWEEVSDQTVTNCFRNKAQHGVAQTLAGDVDSDDYVDFDKAIASSMPAVDAGSISWRQEIRKEIIEKHEIPAC